MRGKYNQKLLQKYSYLKNKTLLFNNNYHTISKTIYFANNSMYKQTLIFKSYYTIKNVTYFLVQNFYILFYFKRIKAILDQCSFLNHNTNKYKEICSACHHFIFLSYITTSKRTNTSWRNGIKQKLPLFTE